MILTLGLSVLAGLLVAGALIDIESRRLPNWLTGAVAGLYGLYVAVSPLPIAWPTALIVAALVFTVGFALFAFQLMGGGDVKFLSALALWAGVEHIAMLLIVTALAGGLLSIAMLTLRRWARFPLVPLLAPVPSLITRRLFGSASITEHVTIPETTSNDFTLSLPYGVAIAAGGFAVIYALLQT